jgi:sporulation protein YlmC with PRC-barrel domain
MVTLEGQIMKNANIVSRIALMAVLAAPVAGIGLASAALAQDSSAPAATTPPPMTPTPPAMDATQTPVDTTAEKGKDVTVIDVDSTKPAETKGTLADLVPGQLTAEDVIGMSVVNASGETIGDVTDLVLDKDKAVYAVMSVGGFLGIGAEEIAIPFEKIQINQGDNKVQLVANVTEDELKALAEQQRDANSAAETAAAGTAADTTAADTTAEVGRAAPAATDTTAPAADMTAADATAPAADTTAPAADTTTTAATTTAPAAPDATAVTTTDTAAETATTAPAADTTTAAATDTAATGSQLSTDSDDTTAATSAVTEESPAAGTQVAAADASMTAEDIIGKSVVNADGDTVGTVDDLVIDDKKVVLAVVSVGGFLGIGAKDVAVPLEQLTLSEDHAMLTSGLTKDDLTNMPAYNKGDLTPVERTQPVYNQ